MAHLQESITRYGRFWLGVAALIVLCVCAFAPGLDGELVFLDDEHYVKGNAQVHQGLTWETVKWSFTTLALGNWHPLTWLTYLLDWELFGSDPRAFHITNLAWHIGAVLLLFGVLFRVSRDVSVSLLAVALFAVHPLRVESVVWISERKDVLSGFFLALTLWLYLAYCDRPSRLRYWWVTLAYAAGLLSKPVLVTLPALMLLLDVWPSRRLDLSAESFPWRGGVALVKEKLPLVAMAIASAAVTLVAQQRAMASFEAMPITVRIANALVSTYHYLRTTIWPKGLAPFYPLEPPGELEVLVAFLVVATLSAFALAPRIRRVEWTVGWGWFVTALLPTIGLVQVGGQARADRYTYVPAIGLSLALLALARAVGPKGRRRVLVLGACVVMGLVGASRSQSRHWVSNEALLMRIVSVTQRNWLAEATLASLLARQGDGERAVEYYHRALAVRPDHRPTRRDLAETLRREGRPHQALEQYRLLLAAGPPEPGLRVSFAAALDDAGMRREALLQLLLAADEESPPSSAWAGLVALSKQAGPAEVLEVVAELQRRHPGARFAGVLREALETGVESGAGELDPQRRQAIEMVAQSLREPLTPE